MTRISPIKPPPDGGGFIGAPCVVSLPQYTDNMFWNKEYRRGAKRHGRESHLALSTKPSADLVKFGRWLEREHGRKYLNPLASVLDLGCGNGRNLVYLAQEYNSRGIGYDTSSVALAQARALSAGLNLKFIEHSIAKPLPLPDSSQTIVLDMMSSHVLSEKEREDLRIEIARVLRPGGWLFYKTFLLDEDEHAERLLREHPAGESGTYLHPEIGVAEHVSTEEEIINALSGNFSIYRVERSHRHTREAGGKRRSISVYAERI